MSTLTLKNISISADGRSVVLGASLSLQSGELHVLLGPNGSGKSSLLCGIFGHPKYLLSDGALFMDKEEITALSTEQKARHGLFLSLQHVPEITGVTLLQFLHRVIQARTEDTPSIIDLYRSLEIEAKEVGIDPALLRRQVGSGLSGGEKKQAEMLQMLALKPAFAFLDEIDSGVDVDALEHILRGIARARSRGTGVLWVTHHLSLLDRVEYDRVSVMQGGKIVMSGGRDVAAKIAKDGFAEK